jgi:SH3-like domain-containing protein
MNIVLALLLIAPPPPGAVVVQPVANMYSGPSADTDVVSQAICGTSVVLLEEKGDWVRVRTPDDYPGWMRLAALRRYAPGSPAYASARKTVQVESLFANVYREPSVTKHEPLLTLPYEARLEEAAEVENAADAASEWIEVRLPDERTGWIERGDVVPHPEPLGIPDDIKLARRFIGLTYTWGGTSSFGYDCSGFTQMLLRRRGVLMPRDADVRAAWNGLTAVARNKLRAGDLLFFGPSPQKVTHTGMYLGHGKFIHDTTHEHPGVQVSRLADPHWAKLLVACRRAK